MRKPDIDSLQRFAGKYADFRKEECKINWQNQSQFIHYYLKSYGEASEKGASRGYALAACTSTHNSNSPAIG